ncbi:MAG: type II toxin-antitoxin system PemK/MazF family toxin [Erysipelotrichaceae bacterium]|nr:type II toxin-antitoxin system PemK/MazF family toxin [Erysipelotrichaceae bacterium]
MTKAIWSFLPIGMINKYEIWYANVRFEDSYEIKERPVLIINDLAYFVTAYKMTGTYREGDKEVPVKYWQEAGLSKPTYIRISKPLRLEKTDLTRKIGVLDERDRLRLELRISRY